MNTATNLSGERIARLREQAARKAGPFVDPHVLNRIQRWWRPDLREWARAITGLDLRHPLRDRGVPNWALLVLETARTEEPDPPLPPGLTARREQAEAEQQEQRQRAYQQEQARDREWCELKVALPVRVSVAFNFSRYTFEFYQAGAYHIVVWDELRDGRLHRSPGRALCETPARSKHLHLDNRHEERDAQDAAREGPLPTCKDCWTIALRVASRTKGRSR